ncbi:hypothetical protein [Proteus mirabilis]|uniref:hypothetical protein n=1 Tax=Proteus mirabilis TaxID=584 RepID=UPI000370F5B7|nr:hypothetical protein [Proteus mirabilis]AUU36265.1 hypothetical protein MC72_013160 [Proteus mirabilis]EKU2830462.1 hypothetical protein [Proteus mirabilis]EKW0543430.1 hypothetical protein [Proteus mirabilis]EKW4851194.1 hypothetical protein [Proteus mirabilis]EKY0559346.1 hypothetical protein [Proteus mirabilis]
MSHNSSRAKVINPELPLNQRASNARSCANHVALRLGITRIELFALIKSSTSVDMEQPKNEEELMRAFHYFEQL